MAETAIVALTTFSATIGPLDVAGMFAAMTALLLILAATLIGMLVANRVQEVFGVTGMHAISRVVGVLLCALAVQFVFDGIAQSGLLPTGG